MTIRRENDPMFDGGPDPTELQEKVWGILDDAGAPESLLEAVDKLIFEFEIAAQRDRDEDATYRLWNKD